MRQVTSAVSTPAHSLHPAWHDQNLTSTFGQSLVRLYASLVLVGVMSIGALVYALVGLVFQL